MPNLLFVSLTSYAARFDVLHLTLGGLLTQTVQPDMVLLWVAEADFGSLPPRVLAMQSDRFQIRATSDTRSYKKIVPLLAEQPDAYIVTADDDVYYRANWLEDLVRAAKLYAGQVLTHRAHRITYKPDGQMKSYEDWDLDIGRAIASGNVFGQTSAGGNIFATGAGGVLYPPHSLHPDAVRADLFTRLAPYSDDVWLYWMARRQGTIVRHLGPRFRVLEWPGSQSQSLRARNRGKAGMSGNDIAIAAMTEHFGLP
ncbi:glycosyltransferase family 2 protein [Cypionkella aquatica]|uniref:glycosyltransferase family 2 protein n=1 Tax=Cypionkella aquatica TaxID=1756042 RepID=UPI0024E05C1D|nr:glycosyltransferase family 2 protein [Cypionkella aquatica]